MSHLVPPPVSHEDLVLHGRRYRFDEAAPLEVGSTCRALDVKTGGEVLLKWPETSDDEALLRHEFDVLRQLDHVQIPRPVALGRPRGADHLVLIRAWSLGVGLASIAGDVEAADARRLLVLALNALAHVHRRGFVHGDLKPEHLRVERDPVTRAWRLHIIDFGLAGRLDGSGRAHLRGGTHGFAAPGAEDTGWLEPSDDLFALGRSFEVALGELRPADDRMDRMLALLTSTDRNRRPANGADALERLEATAWPLEGLAGAARAPLHGRDMLMREAEQFLGKLQQRRVGRAVWGIKAEAGAGKSRFLDEFAWRAMLVDAEVYRLDLGESETVTETLSLLRGQLEEHRGDAPSRPQPLDEHLTQHVGASLRARADKHPVWIGIDQGAGSAEVAWDVARRLARYCTSQGPIVVVAAEPPTGPEFEGLRVHTLPGLAEGALLELLDDLAPELDGGVKEALASLAKGSPRRLERLVRSASRFLDADSGAAGSQGDLEQWLRERVTGLGAATRHLLGHLAIVPGALEVSVLEALLGEDPMERLDRLDQDGLVLAERSGVGPPRAWRISLPIVRRIVEEVIGEAGVMALHAEAYAVRSARAEAHLRLPQALLRHALGARDAKQVEALAISALEHLVAAGRVREVAALTSAVAPYLANDTACAFSLAVLAADALLRLGRFDEARAHLDRAAVFLETEPLAIESTWRTRMRLASADLARGEGRLDDALAALDLARREAPDHLESALRLPVYENLGRVAWSMGEKAQAEQVWLEGVDGLKQDDTSAVVGDLWNDLGVAASVRGDLGEARMRYERSLSARRRAGDLEGATRTLTNLASVSSMRGELREARVAYEHALELKRRLGSRAGEALTLRNLGDLACAVGHYATARRHLSGSLAIRSQLGDTLGEAGVMVVQGRMHTTLGHDREARIALMGARNRYNELCVTGPDRAVLLWEEARLALALGRLDEAAVAIRGAQRESQRAATSTVDRQLPVLLEHARWREDWSTIETHLAQVSAGRRIDYSTQCELDLWRSRVAIERGNHERQCAPLEQLAQRTLVADLHPLNAEVYVLLAQCGRRQGWMDEAANWIQHAWQIQQRLGTPDLSLAVCLEKGQQAMIRGQLRQAGAWWQRGIADLLPRLEPLDDQMQLSFLARPDRRTLIARYEACVSRSKVDSEEVEPHGSN